LKVSFLTVENFRHLAEEGTDAYRIFVLPGAWGERWGKDVLISYFQKSDLDTAFSQLDVWTEKVSWKPQHVLARQLVKQPGKNHLPSLVRGGEFSPNQIVRENSLKYEIDFSTGYSVGLFCDQRSNRRFLMKYKPRRTLNCFAYTCAFSVAAASVGSQTLSIDLAAQALARGQKNFCLNGISVEGHRFLTDDVPSVLKRLARRGEKYDCIILDPPTFSRSSKGSFQVERDFPSLLRIALDCAAPRARLLLSTNCSSLQVSDLQKIGSGVAAPLKRSARFYNCESQCDTLGGQSSSTLWMELE
jgi:23S rRNA (cytosine1962-C5)-methyltransferase